MTSYLNKQHQLTGDVSGQLGKTQYIALLPFIEEYVGQCREAYILAKIYSTEGEAWVE